MYRPQRDAATNRPMYLVRPEHCSNSYVKAYVAKGPKCDYDHAVELVDLIREAMRTQVREVWGSEPSGYPKPKMYRDSKFGALRWASNDHVVPTDILELGVYAGAITEAQLALSAEVSEDEQAAAIARYRSQQRAPSEEELYEMRAAFGEGAVVVDVFTGRRTRL